MDKDKFNAILKDYTNHKISKQEATQLLNQLKQQNTNSQLPSYEQSNLVVDQAKEDTLDIAVIGLSAQVPDATDVNEFWINLINGHNAVCELPDEYLGGDKIFKNQSYKWGGILKERGCFDPLFFNISPREAESMNPHQRLILQESWKALEDAGYNPRHLAEQNIGMFIGAEPTGYMDETFTGYSDAIVSSRLSYYLDLKGPALTVNTGCSSSAVALHLACMSLKNKESDVAIAGGVLAKLDQNSLSRLTQIGMLSPTGECCTMDEKGNGTVLSEGVGVVILKRLEDAIKENDHIYGVIKASGMNQDGASNGITAPNGVAQENLIVDTYKRYHINPEEITYIELHGTGTKLGDPIESNALIRAFRKFTTKKNFCALGSVKPYIGHTAAASGVIGLIKILLSMKNGKIPKLINYHKINPLIDIDNSPFFISNTEQEWQVQKSETLAALNSFGHSGTNVHMVISSYTTQVENISDEEKGPYLIPISAKTCESLNIYIEKIIQFLEELSSKHNTAAVKDKRVSLRNIAYTLQVGREAMSERIIFLVYNIAELIRSLKDYLNGKPVIKNCWSNKEQTKQTESSNLTSEQLLMTGQFEQVAKEWVNGNVINWKVLYQGHAINRVSLPTYPFAKEYYWHKDEPMSIPPVNATKIIHPLVQYNVSSVSECCFKTIFTGKEYFLHDHIVKGCAVLPGAATVEMARKAIEQGGGVLIKDWKAIALKNIGWIRPIAIGNEEVEINIKLYTKQENEIFYEIYTETPTGYNDILYSKGCGKNSDIENLPPMNLEVLKDECNESVLDQESFYKMMNEIGIDLGDTYRGVYKVYRGNNKVLGELKLSEHATQKINQFMLHPGMLDSSLQVALVLMFDQMDDNRKNKTPSLPFAVDEVLILKKCDARMWSYARPQDTNNNKYNIDLLNEAGEVCVRFTGLSTRILKEQVHLIDSTQEKIEQPQQLQQTQNKVTMPITSPSNNMYLKDKVNEWLKDMISSVLRIPKQRIQEYTNFSNYGIDSITVMSLNEKLEESLNSVPKTLFFEHENLNALTDFLIETYEEELRKLFNNVEEQSSTLNRSEEFSNKVDDEQPDLEDCNNNLEETVEANDLLDIAIVGMSGKYAQSNSVEELWENIKNGKDCITDIPIERWDHSLYYDAKAQQAGKTYLNKGGFIENIDHFEPLFFNISPKEAEVLPPQERLFLECVYGTLDDSGYTASSLKEKNECVGVYVGVMYEEYQLYGAEEAMKNNPIIIQENAGSIANRVSYFYDFTGPSMAIDTMCSSGYTALHLACQSIKSGECTSAIVGGVNLCVHPNNFITLGQKKFASHKGKCSSFGSEADGFVPGEGIGSILIKPLKAAIKDGDHIYGVIKSSTLNHGGRSNNYTVPNPRQLQHLIDTSIHKYPGNARAISYIEAHGTGTIIGDTIEVNSLTKAFELSTKDKQFCALGSIKSNIGHCESASAMASLMKVLLQFKYKSLVPSLHAKSLNPDLKFNETPFRVQQEFEDWKRPVIEIDGKSKEYPRIAGLSSFGAGGSNAFVILEEYVENQVEKCSEKLTEALVVFSAKTKEKLVLSIKNFLDHLQLNTYTDLDLKNIAYTLQVGRECMEERLCILVDSIESLKQKLAYYLANKQLPDNAWEGYVKKIHEIEDQNYNNALKDINSIQKEKWIEIAEKWIQGVCIKWDNLYKAGTVKRVSLPTYPFKGERYWVPNQSKLFHEKSILVPLQETNNKLPYPVQTPNLEKVLILGKRWKKLEVLNPSHQMTINDNFKKHMVIMCNLPSRLLNEISSYLPHAEIIDLQVQDSHLDECFKNYAVKLLKIIQDCLQHMPHGNVLLQVVSAYSTETQLLAGIEGMLKTAHIENCHLHTQYIEINESISSGVLSEVLIESSLHQDCSPIRYTDGQYFMNDFEEIKAREDLKNIAFKNKGVYLITGGAGGIGFIFAKEIAKQTEQATIILIGRRPSDERINEQLETFDARYTNVIYKSLDISDLNQVKQLIAEITQNYGDISGIIHAAGVVKDNYILKKTPEELIDVLAPKVSGIVNLDQVTAHMPLDFFVAFSSISGAHGNIGQADYAAANAFMDAYIDYRNTLSLNNQRKGKSLSINWPLWKDGGMKVDEVTTQILSNKFGMEAMTTPVGLYGFYYGLNSNIHQIAIAEGNKEKMKEVLILNQMPIDEAVEHIDAFQPIIVDEALLKEKLYGLISELICDLLKVKPEDIDIEISLSEYGFDSILFSELIGSINRALQLELNPTIFFEYPTLEGLIGYLIDTASENIMAYFNIQQEMTDLLADTEIAATQSPDTYISETPITLNKEITEYTNEPIAIVGISGLFPEAPDLEKFWDNLYQGIDCIREIPKDRWDWKAYYGNPFTEPNKTYSKWAGFIEDMKSFDPQFFNISPKEAEFMDPQQRLMMMYIWKAIEDAGYAPKSLAGSNTGLFIGTTDSGYSKIISKSDQPIEAYLTTGSLASIGPNRMSYFLDLHGLSEPVETACSSSLVAVYKAVKALRDGSCTMAIAGGVNTIVSPEAHISFSMSGMLSKEGKCKTFSNKADGYVRGEGVGMLCLKRLYDAQKDNDHIYGVIKGVAVNHGGHASSLTAPNPKAQQQLIIDAIEDAQIDPRTITYVETHGTGTELGDPIEINGLKSAFSSVFAQNNISPSYQYCGLGSVKTNIGHLELASGIAGIVKVLLQLKHKTLVKTLNCEEINPYIELENTPFYLVRENKAWEALKDENGNTILRRAGISSFGFGGVNAHIIIEEYCKPTTSVQKEEAISQRPLVIILSARTKNALKNQAKQLLHALEKSQYTQEDLIHLAYTLQVGRDAMDERLALVVEHVQELKEKLTRFINDKVDEDLYVATYKQHLLTKTTNKIPLDCRLSKETCIQIAKNWIHGQDVEWTQLYLANEKERISLPTYPFDLEEYWIDAVQGNTYTEIKAKENVLDMQVCHISLTGDENFLQDHIVNGKKTVPATATLEIVKQAFKSSKFNYLFDTEKCIIQDVAWLAPIIVLDHPITIHLMIEQITSNTFKYRMYSDGASNTIQETTFNVGKLVLITQEVDLKVDLTQLRRVCGEGTIDKKSCYERFSKMGLVYGPSHRWLENIYFGDGKALGRLNMPEELMDCQRDDLINPGLFDCAFQTSLGLYKESVGDKTILPVGLEKFEVYKQCTEQMWAIVEPSASLKNYSNIEKFDVSLVNKMGEICAKLSGVTAKLLNQQNHEILQTHNIESKECDKASMEIHTDEAIINRDLLKEKCTIYFKKLISETAKLPMDKIEVFKPLEAYGLDSRLILQLISKLEQTFGEVSNTIFFEYQTLDDLVNYFIETYPDTLTKILNINDSTYVHKSIQEEKINIVKESNFKENIVPQQSNQFTFTPNIQDIAIIGLAGQYAQSRNVEELWDNLKNGNNCITEIPKERWNWEDYYSTEKGVKGTMYTKWGGFIKDYDKFDPLFFHISPPEATKIDPQERLFLQTVYESIEDAGYTPDSLCESKKVGVFVGVMNSNYPVGANYWSIANRVSYTMNFHGPSMAIDTACSSSLTAAHMALESIYSDSSECAIIGGVNLIIDPIHLLRFSMLNMVSQTNECKAFGENADGFVDGEGVGAIIVKPLHKAIEHGDHIYGVIKGSAINSGGKTNGYTVPNPSAQYELVKDALKRANIDARQISYVEAHGTGTQLGDPIEISGLTKAFEDYTNDKQFCAIGSIKTNIGHCEGAAGIAGITKILLQLKHKQLVPSLHSKTLNSKIKFTNTPFTVQQELQEWKRPVINVNGTMQEVPRTAAISSFGAGGANAHLILQEYIPATEEKENQEINMADPAIIVLSARNEETLKIKAKQLLEHIINNCYVDKDLRKIAFTLQVGRQPLEERIAIVVKSLDELIDKLKAFIENDDLIDNLYRGKAKHYKEVFNVLLDEDMNLTINAWLKKKKYYKLADMWVKGLIFDWKQLYLNENIHKISLPTYPFDKKCYWVDANLFKKETIVTEKVTEKVESTQEVSKEPMITETTTGLIQLLAPEQMVNQLDLTSSAVREPIELSPIATNTVITEKQLVVKEDTKKPLMPKKQNSLAQIKDTLRRSLAQILCVTESEVDYDTDFMSLGLDSIIGVEWIKVINTTYGLNISATKVYDYPNISAFAQYIQGLDHSTVDEENVLKNEVVKEDIPKKEHLKAPLIKESSNNIDLNQLRSDLKSSLANILCIGPEEIENDTQFIDMGVDSIIGLEWIKEINTKYHTDIQATCIYDHPNIQSFANHLSQVLNNQSEKPNEHSALKDIIKQVKEGTLDVTLANQRLSDLS